jgi:hypothetical protein
VGKINEVTTTRAENSTAYTKNCQLKPNFQQKEVSARVDHFH